MRLSIGAPWGLRCVPWNTPGRNPALQFAACPLGNPRPLGSLITTNAGRLSLSLPSPTPFLAAPDGDYRLLAGDARAEPPVYEIAEATDLLLAVRAADAEVGAARANAAHVVPAWWEGADAHTWILWAVLLLAVVVLGFLPLRLAGAADADAPAASSDTPADAEPEAADEEAGDEEGGDEPPPSAPGGGGDGPASF